MLAAGTFWQDLEAELPPETYPFPSKALAVLCSQHKLKAEDLHGKAAEMEAVEEMLSRVMPALTTPTSKYADGGPPGRPQCCSAQPGSSGTLLASPAPSRACASASGHPLAGTPVLRTKHPRTPALRSPTPVGRSCTLCMWTFIVIGV